MEDILFCNDVYEPVIDTKQMSLMWFEPLEIERPLCWLDTGLMV
jgi:hypothetical protein